MTDLCRSKENQFARLYIQNKPEFVKHQFSSFSLENRENSTHFACILLISVNAGADIEVNDYSSKRVNRGDGV